MRFGTLSVFDGLGYSATFLFTPLKKKFNKTTVKAPATIPLLVNHDNQLGNCAKASGTTVTPIPSVNAEPTIIRSVFDKSN